MIQFKIYHTYTDLPQRWDHIAAQDVMLKKAYLQALEQAAPNNMRLYYVGLYKEKQLVGIALIQYVQLQVTDLFRTQSSTFKHKVSAKLCNVLNGNLLVVGNLTHTGQHGLAFLNQITALECLEVIQKALDVLKQQIYKQSKQSVRLIVFKDYFLAGRINKEQAIFSKYHFTRVAVQPNMIFKVQPQWTSFNQYLQTLNKKYKRRYKTARKKRTGVRVQELSETAIKAHSKQLYKLYKNVSDNAKFNTFVLPENHFYLLKHYLGHKFKVYGYFLDEQLVGFYTLIYNEHVLETYFLGYDPAYQYTMQLYLNMLYDMVEIGLQQQFSTIVYARTAMEIKSSVGAEAVQMVVYMKHTNKLLNTVFKQLFKLINPKQTWETRHPFKG